MNLITVHDTDQTVCRDCVRVLVLRVAPRRSGGTYIWYKLSRHNVCFVCQGTDGEGIQLFCLEEDD